MTNPETQPQMQDMLSFIATVEQHHDMKLHPSVLKLLEVIATSPDDSDFVRRMVPTTVDLFTGVDAALCSSTTQSLFACAAQHLSSSLVNCIVVKVAVTRGFRAL